MLFREFKEKAGYGLSLRRSNLELPLTKIRNILEAELSSITSKAHLTATVRPIEAAVEILSAMQRDAAAPKSLKLCWDNDTMPADFRGAMAKAYPNLQPDEIEAQIMWQGRRMGIPAPAIG